jgi:hypothetical protein
MEKEPKEGEREGKVNEKKKKYITKPAGMKRDGE